MRFGGKTVWITGASDGIGASLARALAREGARLVLTARSEDKLQAVAASCAPAEVIVLPADLVGADLPALCERAWQAFGHLDVVVSNAGRSQRGLALDTGIEVVRDLMELDFFVPVAVSIDIGRRMVARGSGLIAVTSSLSGHIGTPRRSTYSAAKHAVQGYFDSLRAELHGTGVDVTILSPGYIHTDIAVRAITADGGQHGAKGRGHVGGLDPDACAARMVDALYKRRREVFIGGREVWAVYLKRWLPGLVASQLHKASPEDAT